MPKSHGLAPAVAIVVGMLLVGMGCGAFAGLPASTPTSIPTHLPLATSTTVPTDTKMPTTVTKPSEPTEMGTPAPLPPNTETPAVLDGKTLLEQRCNVCHPSSYVTQLRGTADQWAGLVSMMVQNGAELNPQEQQVLANYLAQKYH